MPVAILRADGNPKMGVGHLMRQFALGEALQEAGIKVVFNYGEAPAGFAGKLGIARFGMAKCAFQTGTSVDAEQLFELARVHQADVIVVDGYHFDEEYQGYLSQMGRPVVCFDDMCHLKTYAARLIVNASPNFAELPYGDVAPKARVLGGPSFALLRKEIRDLMEEPQTDLVDRKHVLVNFGGADPLELTGPVAAWLDEHLPAEVRIDVVTGAAHANPGPVAALAAASSSGRMIHTHNARNMGELMMRAGLAVTGGGGTVAELAALKVPSLLTIIADNQVNAAKGSWCETVDARADRPTDAAEIVARAAVALWSDPEARQAIQDRSDGVIDSGGGARVAAEILKLARESFGMTFNPMR